MMPVDRRGKLETNLIRRWEMKFFVGIDLHSSNNVIVIRDETGHGLPGTVIWFSP